MLDMLTDEHVKHSAAALDKEVGSRSRSVFVLSDHRGDLKAVKSLVLQYAKDKGTASRAARLQTSSAISDTISEIGSDIGIGSDDEGFDFSNENFDELFAGKLAEKTADE